MVKVGVGFTLVVSYVSVAVETVTLFDKLVGFDFG